MKILKILNNFKLLFFLFLFNFLLINSSFSETLKSIEISGNERLADETIVLFSELNLGDEINSSIINSTFKKLYQTNYFKDLKINFNVGNLKIIVKENPIIQNKNKWD